MSVRYHLLLLLAASLFFTSTSVAQTFFTAELTPTQETNDVDSDGAGTAALVLTDEGLRFFVTVDSLTAEIADAHFHEGATGVSGGVVRGISSSFEGNSATGIWTASDDQPLTNALIDELLAGNLYLNIHTATYPGGELRGQILPTSGATLSAHLTPEQETGDVTSEGSGTASVQVTEAGALFFVTVDGLSAAMSDAHFHRAAIGTSGGVVHGIGDAFEGGTAFGLWTPSDDQPLTSDLIAALLRGELYLNVHTSTFPAGEIRGQVLPTSGFGFHAALDASQSTGDVDSDGTATGTFTLTNAGLVFDLTANGLTGPITGAHFHRGAAGEDGGVVRGITGDFIDNTAAGIWTPNDVQPLTDELIQDLLAGNLYVNIHTDAYPAGEIRGQVLLRDGTEMRATLTAAQEFNDIDSDGTGTAALSLTADGLAFRVTVDSLTGPVADAHFHRADIGSGGGVVRGISADFEGNTAEGIWSAADDQPLTAELIQALLEGELYLNIHTSANPGGEIRGQVHLAEGTPLRAFLTNEQTGDVEQEGSGTASLTLTDKGLVYSVTVTGLTDAITNAHFHAGAAGVNGGVEHGIMSDFEGNTATGIWTADSDAPLTEELRAALANGRLYLNIHTAANPGGEIRGQVVLAGGFGSAVQLDPGQQSADVTSSGSGTASLSLTQQGLAYALTATGLTGPINAAHFHNAEFGANGGVVRGITEDFDDGTASGFWQASDEQALSTNLVQELIAGDIYLNLHTAAYPAGEIRGQIHPGNVVSTAIESVSDELPENFRLDQNYPNPFNPTTTIAFSLSTAEHATLEVFDALGRRVATLVDGPLAAGSYRVRFQAGNLPSGVYFYRLAAGSHLMTRSMLLVQ